MPSCIPDPSGSARYYPRRTPNAVGRPYPPEIVAGVRALVEGVGLSYREAGERSGLGEKVVGQWARRYGWRGRGCGGAHVHPPHAEALARPAGPEGEPRSARERRACFEAPLRGAPQHEGNGARSEPDDGLHSCLYGPAMREAARQRVEGTRLGTERIGLELGISRSTVIRWVPIRRRPPCGLGMR